MDNEQKQTEKELEVKTPEQNPIPKTKICKHCATDIPIQAKYCPNCRKRQNKGCLFVGFIVIISIIAINTLLFIISIIVAALGAGNSNLDKVIDNIDTAVVLEETTHTERDIKEPTEIDETRKFEILAEKTLKNKDTYNSRYIKSSVKITSIGSPAHEGCKAISRARQFYA